MGVGIKGGKRKTYKVAKTSYKERINKKKEIGERTDISFQKASKKIYCGY